MADRAIDRAARIGDWLFSTGGIGHDLYVQALQRLGMPPSDRCICADN